MQSLPPTSTRRSPKKPSVQFPFEMRIAVAGGAAFNLFTMPLISAGDRGDTLLVFPIVLGPLISQFALLTLWLVWSEGPFVKRLAIHWMCVIALWIGWALGALTIKEPEILEILQVTACSLPLIMLAIQLPFWPLRIYFGWRIEHKGFSDFIPLTKLSIRDMVMGTIVTSLSLAALRLVPEEFRADPNYFTGWGIGILVIAVLTVLSLVPSILFLFRMRDTSAAVVAFCTYVPLAVMAVLIIFSAFAGGAAAETYVTIGLSLLSFALVLSIALLSIRSQGYRLTFPSDRRKAAESIITP